MTKRVSDSTGLLYLKFAAVVAMIIIHSVFYLLGAGEYLYTDNFLFPWMKYGYPIGILPLTLPAAAGAMLFARLDSSRERRLDLGRSLRILRTAAALMALGLAVNWLVYYGNSGSHLYFQSTLAFVAICFLLIWACSLIHFHSLLGLAIGALIVTALFSDLRYGTRGWFISAMFASDGRQYIWPVFPWVGLVAFGAWIQWNAGSWRAFRRRREVLIAAVAAALAMIAVYGLPIEINPANIWGEAMFQRGWHQAATLMVIYFLLWNLSEFLGRKFPPRAYGMVHVFSQAILYVYVFHMVIAYYLSQKLLELDYTQCLVSAEGGGLTPCLVAATLIGMPLLFLSSWAFAYLIARYFMNFRLRIQLRRVR